MASNAALGSKGGGGTSGECNCNELAVPHTHERSLLDVTIKSMVLGGAIELLPLVKDLVGHQASDSVHLMFNFQTIGTGTVLCLMTLCNPPCGRRKGGGA
jgi:hypothetical protein